MASLSNVPEKVFLYHHARVSQAEDLKETAVAKLRNAKRAAKADGVSLIHFDAARKLAKLDDAERAASFNTSKQYLAYLGEPLFRQLPLIELPELTPDAVMAAAYQRGERAGKLGASETTCPYELNEPAGQEWLRGHRAGANLLREATIEMEVKPQPAPAAAVVGTRGPKKGKGGRPKGSVNKPKIVASNDAEDVRPRHLRERSE